MALIFSPLPNAGGKAVGWVCFFFLLLSYLQVNKVLSGDRPALLGPYCPETPPKQAQTMKGSMAKISI